MSLGKSTLNIGYFFLVFVQYMSRSPIPKNSNSQSIH